MTRAVYRPDPEFANKDGAPGAMSLGHAEPDCASGRGAFVFFPDDGGAAGYYVAGDELELLDLHGEAGYEVNVYTMDADALADEFYVYSGSPAGGFASHEGAVKFVRGAYPDQFEHQQYTVRARSRW